MTGAAGPDVFVDLLDATLRGSKNYHRLEHLGRRTDYTLKEETVTDLLLAEMAGRAYEVSAGCPACARADTCRDWDGGRTPDTAGVRARALTRAQEGGNQAKKQAGAHADFVLTVEHSDPDNSTQGDARQVRLLVQAKRATPGRKFLNTKVLRDQYDGLLAAAQHYGAAPYYALYVQQPDPHRNSRTRCRRHPAAADQSIVLVPAGPWSPDLHRRRHRDPPCRLRPHPVAEPAHARPSARHRQHGARRNTPGRAQPGPVPRDSRLTGTCAVRLRRRSCAGDRIRAPVDREVSADTL